MVRNRLHRFNEQGLQGLEEAPRSGRPVTYEPALVSEIIQTALSWPADLGEEGYTTWTLDRLVDYSAGRVAEAQPHQRNFHRRRTQLAT